MPAQPDRWCRLSAESIGWVPEEAGVFEVANLVRSILYVGRGDGNLRARLAEISGSTGLLPPMAGGFYFRFRLTSSEDEAFAGLVGAYQTRHDGRAPQLNGAGSQRDAA
ncbi:MAG TPA: hypothetical protein VKW76_06365 [Candidatus Binatia bacterium]|nr:hypothetical protein [Candidatus Binatia bacterium]